MAVFIFSRPYALALTILLLSNSLSFAENAEFGASHKEQNLRNRQTSQLGNPHQTLRERDKAGTLGRELIAAQRSSKP